MNKLIIEAQKSLDPSVIEEGVRELRSQIADLEQSLQGKEVNAPVYQSVVADIQASRDSLRSLITRLAHVQAGKSFVPFDPSGMLNRMFTVRGLPNTQLQNVLQGLPQGQMRDALTQLINAMASYIKDTNDMLAAAGARSVGRLSITEEDRAVQSIINLNAKVAAGIKSGAPKQGVTLQKEIIDSARASKLWNSGIERVLAAFIQGSHIVVISPEGPGMSKLIARAREIEIRLAALADQTSIEAIVENAGLQQELTSLRKQIGRG